MVTKYLNAFFSQAPLFIVLLLLFGNCTYHGQIDVSRFYDSAHHWYDINDQDKVVYPLPEKPTYPSSEVAKIADNILLFQKSNGGWAKNYDMQAILTDEQVKKVINDKEDLNTTFDNGATHSQLRYLAEAYTITKNEKYKESFLKGLDYIFSAQYDNGGWPQFYPDTKGYRKYITFNDGAMLGVMNVLFNIVSNDPSYQFVSKEDKDKVQKSYDKGLQCILDCQIVENGVMNVWCQQHDNKDLRPQNARTYELASICNMESAEITLFLMKINNPDEKIKNSINSAVQWFEESAISGIKVEIIKAPETAFKYHKTDRDKIVVKDDDAPRIWARFYELGTHVPLFCRRDGVKVYTLAEVERERRTGYGWHHYAPEEVLKKYPKWLEKWN